LPPRGIRHDAFTEKLVGSMEQGPVERVPNRGAGAFRYLLGIQPLIARMSDAPDVLRPFVLGAAVPTPFGESASRVDGVSASKSAG
jgi:hypothetical protein